jgi:BirA family biotin operon repressor/biotin-[acetyl-CoA-carboxylase] ligase
VSHHRLGRRILRYDVLGSTMDEAARLAAAGEPEGIVVLAAEQTAGRGRAGRSWVTPPGTALLCSVVLRPRVAPDRLPILSLLIGVAAAGAIAVVTGLEPRLKWPNDLWLGDDDPGRKVGGILLTSRLGRGGVDSVVAGVGINVTTKPDDLPPGATSLGHEVGGQVSTDDLLTALLLHLNRVYDGFLAAGGRPSLDPWRQRAALIGQPVTVTDGARLLTGRFTGVDDHGRLVLEDEQGQVHHLTAGDLTRGPRSLLRG